MAIDTWDIYITDNGETVVDLLEGISQVVYGGQLQGLVLATLSLALFFLAFRFVVTGGWQGALRWSVMTFFIVFAVTLPKKPVLVQDYSNPTFARVVEDVPIGLAAVMSFSTVIGHNLTRIFETSYGTVDGFGSHAGFQYSAGGMLAGERTLESLLSMDAQDPRVITNVNNFLAACVYPEAIKEKDFSKIQTEDNFAELFASNNEPDLTFYKAPGATASYIQCNVAGPLVANDIKVEAGIRRTAVGRQIHPNLDAATANSKYDLDIDFVAERFLALDDDGPNLISQVMSINMIKNSMADRGSDGGEAALMDFVNAQATVQSRLTMASIGGLMQTALPKMHSILVIILVALFPVVFALSMLPGGGTGTIKNYFLFFLNLQVWPLMFSVFSRIIEGETIERARALTKAARAAAQAQAQAAAGGSSVPTVATPAHGIVDMSVLDPLAALPSETSAIALMMIGLIPGIAIMLTKGYSAVAGQVESTLRPISVATENAAAAGATGNISLGNANLQTRNVRGWNQDQVNTSPSLDYGQKRGYTETGAQYLFNRKGGVVTQGAQAQGSSALSANFQKTASDSWELRRSDAVTERETASTLFGRAVSSAGTQVFGSNYADNQGESFEKSFGSDENKSHNLIVGRTYADMAKWANEQNMSDSQEARNYFNKAAEAHLSLGGEGFGFGGGAKLSGSIGEDLVDSERASEYMSDYFSRSENRDQAVKYSKAVSEIESNRNRLNMGSNSSESSGRNANLTKAENFRKDIVKAENDIASLDEAYRQSKGFTYSEGTNIMGRAQEIVQNQEGHTEAGKLRAAEIFGALPSDEYAMSRQRAAIGQALQEQIDRGHYRRNSKADMTMGSVLGPTEGEAEVLAHHQAEKANVSSHAETNQVLTDTQQAAFMTDDEIREANADRLGIEGNGEQLAAKVVKSQGGMDVTDYSKSITQTTQEVTPRGIAESEADYMQRLKDRQEAVPDETRSKIVIGTGGYGMGAPAYYDETYKPNLTPEQIAEVPIPQRPDIRGQADQAFGTETRSAGAGPSGTSDFGAGSRVGEHFDQDAANDREVPVNEDNSDNGLQKVWRSIRNGPNR